MFKRFRWSLDSVFGSPLFLVLIVFVVGVVLFV